MKSNNFRKMKPVIIVTICFLFVTTSYGLNADVGNLGNYDKLSNITQMSSDNLGVNNPIFLVELQLEWNIISIPDNITIQKEEIIIFYNGTDYSWENATGTNNEEGEPLILGFIYEWNASSQNYDTTETLQPAQGYWVYAYYACDQKVQLSIYCDGHSLDAADGDPVDAVYVDNDGKVGIGTTNPEQKLHVSNGKILLDNNQEIQFLDTIGTKRTTLRLNSDNNLEIWNLPGDILINCGGNVGIGTTSPNSDLEVNGTVHSTSGGFKFPDGTIQTTASTSMTPMQIALLRWYEANEAGNSFSVGDGPIDVAFDGDYIWVTNLFNETVSKLRASDGYMIGSYNVGDHPVGVAFDGANIWVVNQYDDTVSKLKASDGSLIGTYNVGSNPHYVVFDGAYIWVTNYYDDTVSKLHAYDGSLVGTYNVGDHPVGIAFDGANIWITNHVGDTVSKLHASNGSHINTYNIGDGPIGIVFDGVNIWAVNEYDGTVSKLRSSDGSLIDNYNVGSHPVDVVFDGASIWVANLYDNSVSKLKASDGSLIGTYYAGRPYGIAFDGVNIWATNNYGDAVTKL